MKIHGERHNRPDAPNGLAAGKQMDWHHRFGELAATTQDPRLRTYYRHPPPPVDTPVRDAPMLALDLETSGLDEDRDAIVSIGFIPFDPIRIRCAGARHWIVQPDRTPGEIAAPIHGITHASLKAALTFENFFETLLQAMAGKIVVAHCAAIERRFLSAASIQLTGEQLLFPVIDTMRLEEKKYPHRPFDWLLQWFLKADTPSLRLDATRKRYGLPSYRPHHALTDALATAELLQAQLQADYCPQAPVAQFWC